MAKLRSRTSRQRAQPLSVNLSALPELPEPEPDPSERVLLIREILASGAMPRIMGYLKVAGELGFDTRDPEVIRRAIRAGKAEIGRETSAPPAGCVALRPGSPLVYYMRMSTLIKIGTTVDLPRRISSIAPQDVLAVERGGEDLETARHRQFAAWRSHGEWFHDNVDLAAHIAALRAGFADEMGETFDTWLDRCWPARPQILDLDTLDLR